MKTILALLMMALSATAYGQLVRCVSKDGKVEYARDCPPGTTEQKTGIKSSPGSGAPGAAPPAQKSLVERDADFKKRMIEQQEAQQKAQKQSAEAEQKQQACENAQAYVKAIESGQRLTRTDPKTGERAFMEDSERDAELVKAQQRVTQNCN